jgi:hypothetical protein
MTSMLAEWCEHARSLPGASNNDSGRRTRDDRVRAAAMRHWARRNGFDIADKGRIRRAVVDAYTAHERAVDR